MMNSLVIFRPNSLHCEHYCVCLECTRFVFRPDTLVGWRGDPPPRHLQRLVLGAYDASPWVRGGTCSKDGWWRGV